VLFRSQLWYTVNRPEKREDFDGKTYLKFMYGDMVEHLILFLVELTGRTVKLNQETIEFEGIKGHPDAIIDGVLIDVKSASGYGMNKFTNHTLEKDDPFNYLYQLSLYLEALKDHPDLEVKKEGAFLAVDKSDGTLALDFYKKKNVDFKEEAEDKKAMLLKEKPPARCYEPVADGLSGNMKLPMPCVYCGFKRECHTNLRAFKYSNGTRYLTKVVKEPDVEELKVTTKELPF